MPLSKPSSTMALPRLTALSLAERVPLMACRGAKPPNLVMIFQCTIYMKGISVNSTPLEHIHKVFKGIAQRGECSMGWFLGFKARLICNEKGELLDFMIIPGGMDDMKILEHKDFVEFIYGKSTAGKGYVGKDISNACSWIAFSLSPNLKVTWRGFDGCFRQVRRFGNRLTGKP